MVNDFFLFLHLCHLSIDWCFLVLAFSRFGIFGFAKLSKIFLKNKPKVPYKLTFVNFETVFVNFESPTPNLQIPQPSCYKKQTAEHLLL